MVILNSIRVSLSVPMRIVNKCGMLYPEVMLITLSVMLPLCITWQEEGQMKPTFLYVFKPQFTQAIRPE